METQVKIAVVSAGLSTPSSTRILADQLADAALAAVRSRGQEVQVDVVELRPLAHGLADAMLTGFPVGDLETALGQVKAADALVVVSPVFQGSYSGLFKTFFDLVEPEALTGKPVLMAATAGTARHSLVLEFAMRPLFAHLRAAPLATAVFAASEDFGPASDGSLTKRIERAGAELAAAVGPGRPVAVRRERTLEERFADPTPFAEMLQG